MGTTGAAGPIGTVILFKGRVAQIDAIGRTSAQVTVASDLVLLDIDMPRTSLVADCKHVLYDSGCGLARGTYSASGTVGAAGRLTTITWTGATTAYTQGDDRLHFGRQYRRHGDDQGRATSSGLMLAYPLPNAPTRRRRLYRGAGLRPHHGDVPGQLQQPVEFPRLSLRAAAADHDRPAFGDPDAGRQGQVMSIAIDQRRANRGAQRAAVVAEARKWIVTPYHHCADILRRRRRLRHADRARFRRSRPRRRLRSAPLCARLDDPSRRGKISGLFQGTLRARSSRLSPAISRCSATAAAIRMAASSRAPIPLTLVHAYR